MSRKLKQLESSFQELYPHFNVTDLINYVLKTPKVVSYLNK